MTPRLFLMPLNFDEANELVRRWHRHHRPVITFRYAIAEIAVADEAGSDSIWGDSVGEPGHVAPMPERKRVA